MGVCSGFNVEAAWCLCGAMRQGSVSCVIHTGADIVIADHPNWEGMPTAQRRGPGKTFASTKIYFYAVNAVRVLFLRLRNTDMVKDTKNNLALQFVEYDLTPSVCAVVGNPHAEILITAINALRAYQKTDPKPRGERSSSQCRTMFCFRLHFWW